ncbi:unnamed protein product [Diplocarpon coronariae]
MLTGPVEVSTRKGPGQLTHGNATVLPHHVADAAEQIAPVPAIEASWVSRSGTKGDAVNTEANSKARPGQLEDSILANAALRSPSTAKRDSTLCSVAVLCVCGTIAGQSQKSSDAGAGHIRGCVLGKTPRARCLATPSLTNPPSPGLLDGFRRCCPLAPISSRCSRSENGQSRVSGMPDDDRIVSSRSSVHDEYSHTPSAVPTLERLSDHAGA